MTWDNISGKRIPTPDKMTAFFQDIIEVYRKHGLSISHEDGHGAFIIEPYSEANVEWLKDALKEYE